MGFLAKLWRGISSIASKGFSVVKKLTSSAWNAATSFFTFGSSLSLEGITTGWSNAIGGVLGALGIQGGTLGNVLSGAIEYAGYGALGGAATAAVTGGDVGKGALQGAAVGALTGGIAGATRPTGVLDQVSAGPSSAPPTSGPFGPPQGADIGASAPMASNGGALNRLFEPGGWLERNQAIVGPIIAGLGEGALGAMAAKDELEAHERMQTNRQQHNPGRLWDAVGAERWRRPREDMSESKTGMMHPSNVY